MARQAYQYAIIGGGIIGLSTAYALQLRHPKSTICVIEAGPECGFGASWANGSMIHPSQATPWRDSHAPATDPALVRDIYQLAVRSSAILRARFNEFDIAPRHRREGCAKIYTDVSTLQTDQAKLQVLMALGLPTEFIDSSQIEKRLNISADGAVGAYIFPNDHSGPARLYCRHLAARLAAGGAKLMTANGAANIEGQDIMLQSGAIVAAQNIIVAAGSGSAALVNIAGQHAVRGYSRTFELPGHEPDFPVMPVMDDAAHMAIAPMGTHLRVSGGADPEPMNSPHHLDRHVIYDALEAYLRQRCPGLPLDNAPKSDWTALRPMSDQGPVIACLRDGLFVNTGHGHMGWTLSAGAADRIVDIINGAAA
ncbi:NAD(P)/FAD-dependent oxidoreductase [Robiginitomaculum antarcticum]|uniref:NAD(P)/FAD-dependent oxidoreductase n=1 Tax=Robiginitomaculum antarcticum TaxID=437507 RepID=UPI000369C153|nr:FAD-dependent oxidoreductase [Robiginitomaculum antarcticum]